METEIVIGNQYSSIISSADADVNNRLISKTVNSDKIAPFNPMIRKRSVRTQDLIRGLKQTIGKEPTILPSGCKYHTTLENGYKIYVIEEPPRIRTIKVACGIEQIVEQLKNTGKLEEYGYADYLKETERFDGYHPFQLSFPYIVYIITLTGNNGLVEMRPFFRLQPIRSLSDYVLLAPLYNIPGGQTICLGGVQSYRNTIDSIENIIETFWLNIYNYDYTDNVTAYRKTDAHQVHDYLSWMYFSKIDPMFIYSVKWIPYHKNLGKIINQISEYSSSGESSSYLFNDVYQSLVKAKSSPQNNKLSYNGTLQTVIDNDIVSVGDEIIFEDKPYYLYSIITNRNDYDYHHVELQDEDGVIMEVPFKNFKSGYKSTFVTQYLDEVEINGQMLKPNSVIKCEISGITLYKKISKLRKAIDGRIEAMVGNDHYLIDNIDFELFDPASITFNDEPLDSSKTYKFVKEGGRYFPRYSYVEAEFETLSARSNGHMILKFKNKSGGMFSLNLEDFKNKNSGYIIADDVSEQPLALSAFSNILVNNPKVNESRRPPFKLCKNKGVMIPENIDMRDYRLTNNINSYDESLEYVLFEENQRLWIPGITSDFDFRVGDAIIHFDWSNPDDMLMISKIDNFEYVDSRRIVYVNSTSLNGVKKFRIPVVSFYNNTVAKGRIRKVHSNCLGWKSGDKIKANKTGISNFAKKDVNTIIAFIDDGNMKYPLAFCSNLCTLWMNEETINSFDVTPIGTPNWDKLEAVPYDLNKIKWQHGDLFCHTYSNRDMVTMFVLTKRNGTSFGTSYSQPTNNGQFEHSYDINKADLNRNYQRYGIITPRYKVSSETDSVVMRGFPDLLGGYIPSANCGLLFRSEQFKEDF